MLSGYNTEKKKEIRQRVLEMLRQGCSIDEIYTELGVKSSTILHWRNKYPKFKEQMDNAVNSYEARLYQNAIKKLDELAGNGNIEALKAIVKQVQGSARRFGHSGSDIKQSNINIDASDNRQINLSNMLSHDTVEKLKALNPAEKVGSKLLEGVGEKVN